LIVVRSVFVQHGGDYLDPFVGEFAHGGGVGVASFAAQVVICSRTGTMVGAAPGEQMQGVSPTRVATSPDGGRDASAALVLHGCYTALQQTCWTKLSGSDSASTTMAVIIGASAAPTPGRLSMRLSSSNCLLFCATFFSRISIHLCNASSCAMQASASSLSASARGEVGHSAA